MLAFTHDTIPKIIESVDFLNIMTYDLMNRRDNVTKHHTGVQNSLEAINAYLERGVPAEKANLASSEPCEAEAQILESSQLSSWRPTRIMECGGVVLWLRVNTLDRP